MANSVKRTQCQALYFSSAAQSVRSQLPNWARRRVSYTWSKKTEVFKVKGKRRKPHLIATYNILRKHAVCVDFLIYFVFIFMLRLAYDIYTCYPRIKFIGVIFFLLFLIFIIFVLFTNFFVYKVFFRISFLLIILLLIFKYEQTNKQTKLLQSSSA